jgi:hypothetical protein
MNGAELYQLAQSGVNINITVSLPELLQVVQEADHRATERMRHEWEERNKTPDEMITVKEFCDFWKISPKTLANWEKRKVLSVTMVGGEIRIDPEEQRRLRAMRRKVQV